MSTPSSVSINSLQLRPAPSVSTSYEYAKSGDYIIGGFLIVTLSGSIIGQDIVNQISQLNDLQVGSNCVTLVVGCQGGSDFLSGSGRVRSVDISRSDQPFISEYSITIAIETIGGKPAVSPDPEFLRENCLNNADYILAYSEEISVDGGEQIGQKAIYNGVNFGKSYLKGKGRISITTYGREICGVPSHNGTNMALDIINSRFNAISQNFDSGCSNTGPLKDYGAWEKWIDNKTIDIGLNGSAVTCSFDLYLTKGTCNTMALVDLTVEQRKDLLTDSKSTTISGTIKGLSKATTSLGGTKAQGNERGGNAGAAFKALKQAIENTRVADLGNLTPSTSGSCAPTDPCLQKPKLCTQIISVSTITSFISGEITFNMEVGDITDDCGNGNAAGKSYNIETSVEETLFTLRHQEVIIPNRGTSVIQILGDAPQQATVTTRANLTGCDAAKFPQLKACAQRAFTAATQPYNGWLVKAHNTTTGKFSYSESKTYIKCN